ncbi:MAG: replication initiation protein [Terrimicrobiaceae bacterium]
MENRLARKSNALIEASYKLSTVEQKIILFLASTIKPDDEDFKSYPTRLKDFQDFVGNSSVHYERIEDMILSLKEKNLKIVYPNPTFTAIFDKPYQRAIFENRTVTTTSN